MINMLLQTYLKEIEKKVISNKGKMEKMSEEILFLKNRLNESDRLISNLRSENTLMKSKLQLAEKINDGLSRVRGNLEKTFKENFELSEKEKEGVPS